MSPTRRRRLTITLSVLAFLVLAAAGLVLRLRGDAGATTATGTPEPAPATTTAAPSIEALPWSPPPPSGASTPAAMTSPVTGPSTSAAPSTTAASVPTSVASDPPRSPASGRVDVVLTYAGWVPDAHAVQAGGYAGTLEDDGACTLTLTSGGRTVTARSQATADVSTTTCGMLRTTAPLAPGTWTVVLGYASSTSTGSSAPATVTVP